MYRIIDSQGGRRALRISEHILEETNKIGISIRKLNNDERENLLYEIEKKYLNNKSSLLMWERLQKYEALSDKDAWGYLKDYINNENCILFFNQEEDKEMFEVDSGYDMHTILSETYGYEFYITNSDCSYLLCFNHHDILYGAGDSQQWVLSMK